jgi:hypothetical protein
MTLCFPYRLVPISRPPVALAGRWVRPRPIITVSVVGPSDTQVLDGLLDTGSDDTVIPERFAVLIGLDLANAPTGQGAGATMAAIPVRYAQVRLRVTDGREFREWAAWVGFSATIRRALLGFAGFLQFFSAHFHGDREQVELTVNSLYSGT